MALLAKGAPAAEERLRQVADAGEAVDEPGAGRGEELQVVHDGVDIPRERIVPSGDSLPVGHRRDDGGAITAVVVVEVGRVVKQVRHELLGFEVLDGLVGGADGDVEEAVGDLAHGAVAGPVGHEKLAAAGGGDVLGEGVGWA